MLPRAREPIVEPYMIALAMSRVTVWSPKRNTNESLKYDCENSFERQMGISVIAATRPGFESLFTGADWAARRDAGVGGPEKDPTTDESPVAMLAAEAACKVEPFPTLMGAPVGTEPKLGAPWPNTPRKRSGTVELMLS